MQSLVVATAPAPPPAASLGFAAPIGADFADVLEHALLPAAAPRSDKIALLGPQPPATDQASSPASPDPTRPLLQGSPVLPTSALPAPALPAPAPPLPGNPATDHAAPARAPNIPPAPALSRQAIAEVAGRKSSRLAAVDPPPANPLPDAALLAPPILPPILPALSLTIASPPAAAGGVGEPAIDAAPTPPPIARPAADMSCAAPSDDPPPAAHVPPPDLALPQSTAPPLTATPPQDRPIATTMPAAANAATQIGTAVLVLARDPAGPHAMTLHLQPPDLGHVAIAIAPPHAGETRIALTVQQPETLLLLLRDQPALHKALDSAGIAQDGRVVTFHLAPTDAPAPVAAPANGAFNDAGQPGTQDRGNRAPQHASAARSDHPSAKNDAAADHTLPPRRAPRPGVDITA